MVLIVVGTRFHARDTFEYLMTYPRAVDVRDGRSLNACRCRAPSKFIMVSLATRTDAKQVAVLDMIDAICRHSI